VPRMKGYGDIISVWRAAGLDGLFGMRHLMILETAGAELSADLRYSYKGVLWR